MHKSLDVKLASIHAGPRTARDFILADAKDADMAWGLAAPGKDPATGKLRSLADYRDQMREITSYKAEENAAESEIPEFMALRARKQNA